MYDHIATYRKSEIVEEVRLALQRHNGNWDQLLGVLRTRSLAAAGNNSKVSSSTIADTLNKNDRTVRGDSGSIDDLLTFLFANAPHLLYRVSIGLKDGRPRNDEYHRLYTFVVGPNKSHPHFHLGKLWLPLIPYLPGEESSGVQIVHPKGEDWSAAALKLAVTLAKFGADVSASTKFNANILANHTIVLGTGASSSAILNAMRVSQLPALREYTPESGKVFFGRSTRGEGKHTRSTTAILAKQQKDVLRLVHCLCADKFAKELVEKYLDGLSDQDSLLLGNPFQCLFAMPEFEQPEVSFYTTGDTELPKKAVTSAAGAAAKAPAMRERA